MRKFYRICKKFLIRNYDGGLSYFLVDKLGKDYDVKLHFFKNNKLTEASIDDNEFKFLLQKNYYDPKVLRYKTTITEETVNDKHIDTLYKLFNDSSS